MECVGVDSAGKVKCVWGGGRRWMQEIDECWNGTNSEAFDERG